MAHRALANRLLTFGGLRLDQLPRKITVTLIRSCPSSLGHMAKGVVMSSHHRCNRSQQSELRTNRFFDATSARH